MLKAIFVGPGFELAKKDDGEIVMCVEDGNIIQGHVNIVKSLEQREAKQNETLVEVQQALDYIKDNKNLANIKKMAKEALQQKTFHELLDIAVENMDEESLFIFAMGDD